MKIAIMQPYFMPYIGYFQLIHAVNVFVFYDDVHFNKRGWINRNKVLVNGKENLFTIALSKASQNKLINEIEVSNPSKSFDQLLKSLEYNYKRAPHFNDVYNLVSQIINKPYKTISDLAINSVKLISEYLELKTLFEISSKSYPKTKVLDKSSRLIAISKKKGCSDYINPSGGKELYNKQKFKMEGINLQFIENELRPYNQFDNIPLVGLSIIDVLMFNSKEETIKLIKQYKLV